jgi:hypothetical protein
VGNVQQSVTRFDPIAPMRISVRPRSGLQQNDRVKSHSSHTSLIEVLAARYPVIRRLVGELSFRIVARRFILSEPPNIAMSLSYGDNLPRFLRGQGSAASFEYVADIAELEMVREKARRAPDVRPLAAEALLPLRDQWLNGLRIALHPSVCLVQSRFPIVTIWENNQSDDENGMIDRWSGRSGPGGTSVSRGRSSPPSTRRLYIRSRPIRRAIHGNRGARCNRSYIQIRGRLQSGASHRCQCDHRH